MILAAESRLGLPLLFYFGLLNENSDWSFVVKTHALFEGVLNQTIRHALQFQEVGKKADSRGWKTKPYPQKLQLALQLGVLEQDYYNFLKELGRLRNQAVHRINFLQLNLRDFSENQEESEEKINWVSAMGAGWKEMPASDWADQWIRAAGRTGFENEIANKEGLPKEMTEMIKKMSLRDFMVGISPRAAIWFAGIWTLHLLSLWLHSRFIGGKQQLDKNLEPNLQDLLFDPQVLNFKREIFGEKTSLTSEIQTQVICHEVMFKFAVQDFRTWDWTQHGRLPPTN